MDESIRIAEAQTYPGTDVLAVMENAVNYNRFLSNLVEKYASPSDSILDFGAGSGQFAKVLELKGYKILCVEPDASLGKGLSQAGLKAVSSLEHVEDQSIDYGYSLNVLEHVSDDLSALRTLYAKLKPNGRLLIYVPAMQWLYTHLDRRIGHVQRYSMRTLSRSLESAGFSIERMHYVDSLGVLAAAIFKLFVDRDGTLSGESVRIYDRFGFPLSTLLDRLLGSIVGKNILALARRP
jgi:SAM-dependent methyltransferase